MKNKYSTDFVQERLILFDLLKKNAGIKKILQEGYRHLQNPVLLNDTSFQLISSFGGEPEDDTYFTKKSHKFMRNEVLQKLFHQKFPDELLNASGAYLGFQIEKSRYLLLCPIYISNKMAGFLCILPQNRDHDPTDVSYVNFLADALSIEMQKDRMSTDSAGITREFLINRLLEGAFESEQQITGGMQILNLKKQKYYTLAMFTDPHPDSFSMSFETLSLHIRKLLPSALVTLYQGHCLLLLGSDREPVIHSGQSFELDSFLKNNKIKFLESNTFTNLLNLPVYFTQLVRLKDYIEQYVSTNHSIYTMDEYLLPYLVHFQNTHQDLQAVIHPDLYKLIQFDQKNSTDYLSTIEAYLENKNNSRAAEALHIHKTTFSYRMDKIEDLLGKNFTENNDLQFQYLLSLKLLKLTFTGKTGPGLQ